ncbi:MAG TPA: tetratricopeptide repeat protein [Ornithinimicrobium sp.]|nr:tetratricopeptide repeat protein [Ornithinimicrobium sp.]
MDEMERMLRGLGAGGDDGVDGADTDPVGQVPPLPSIELPGAEELDDHARYDRATFLFQSRSYSRAVELLVPLVETNPGNAEVRLLLARAHYHSASLGRAEEALRGLLERWPTDAYAHLLLARTLQRAGRAEEGAPHLKIAEAMGLEA